jgi:HAD superfamily hydrolase (TIGR01509 family)
VLFDVGYGLLDEAPRLEAGLAWLADFLTAHGVPADAKRLGALYRAACLAPTQPSLFVQTALAAGAPPDLAKAQRKLLPWDAVPMTALPGALEAVERLARAGLRVGVLANQPASARADLERTGLLRYLDGVWLSEEAGLAKPDPAFFRLALDAWRLPAARVAYVGDRPDNDVRPARALGLHTVRLRLGPHAAHAARGTDEEAHHDVATLLDAAAHLEAWARSRA